MISGQAYKLVETLGLEPHPEGGFFRETYRSDDFIKGEHLSNKYNGNRNFSTAIYYLLTADTFSAFHRIHQDEVWHFYEGSGLIIHEIDPAGRYTKTVVGSNIENAEVFQYVVKGGNYFAVELMDGNDYGLAGCTVAPGFDFVDFDMPGRSLLLEKFPQHEGLITRLTRA
ncbi:MAG: cupin domain-containing protein [Bacteroidia bacterium]|nr:cupin domain-containing protein [Bacteroidia bacterium]